MNNNIFKATVKLFAIPLMVILTACSSLVSAANGLAKTPTLPAITVTAVRGTPSVTVKDQEFDGTTVVVEDAFSQGPGWMVIHNQVDGAMGLPIGYTQIYAGDNKNISVKIDPTQTTPVMYAMLHEDSGTIGKYEFPGPDVPVMFNGEMVAPPFKAILNSSGANLTPSLTVLDQSVTNQKVTIASVTSNGPGWVSINIMGPNGNPGTEIGYSAVKTGTTQNLIVNIDASKASPVLFAMLHTDAGIIGKYEYPGPDVPQQADGQIVSPSFRTSPAATVATPTSGAYEMYPTMGVTKSAPTITPTPDMGMGMVMSTPSANITPLVKVSDQQVKDGEVMVDEVVSVGPGWIVIYSTNANGQPDQPIGHAAVKDGDNLAVMVPVDLSKAKGTLFAQLQTDGGTVGTFEYPGPDAPVMIGVQMIASTFKITSAKVNSTPAAPVILQPSITVSDQAIKDDTVTISQVVSNGNWWLVIHRQNPDGSMGDYIGETLIKNGVNSNVVVKIDLKKATPVLFAMLHEDHGIIGQLEIPLPDVAVLVNGQMVAPKFNVTGLAQDVTINIQKVSNSVSYLTNGTGMSLYISLQDTPGKNNCNAACQTIWQPLLVSGKIIAGKGITLTNLGIIMLPDGTHQVTYLGAPLYTYIKDVNPGDTNGHGLYGVWFLVAP